MIQRIGRPGGKRGSLKYEPGFDYYRYSYLASGGSVNVAELIVQDSLTFADLFRFFNGAFTLEITLNCTYWIRNVNPSPIEYNCVATESPTVTLFAEGIPQTTKELCPINVGAGDTIQVSMSGYYAYSFANGENIIFRNAGGSRNLSVVQSGGGIMKLTPGFLRQVNTTGAGTFYDSISLVKLN